MEGSNCKISENEMLGKLFGEKINAKGSKYESWEKEMFCKLSGEKINVDKNLAEHFSLKLKVEQLKLMNHQIIMNQL